MIRTLLFSFILLAQPTFAEFAVAQVDSQSQPSTVKEVTCQYLRRCLEEYKAAPENTREQLIAGCTLVGGWLQVDLDQALKQTGKNLQLAQRLRDVNGTAVSKLQMAFVKLRQLNVLEARKDYENAVTGFDDAIEDDFTLAFYSSKYAYQSLDLDLPNNDLAKAYEQLKQVLQKSSNPNEILWAKIGCLLAKAMGTNFALVSAEIDDLKHSIRTLSTQLGLEIGEAACLVAESRLAIKEKDYDEFIRLSPLVDAQLKKEGGTALTIVQRSTNSTFYSQMSNLKKLRMELFFASEGARKLKSPDTEFPLIVSLGLVELQLGNVELASKWLKRAETIAPTSDYRAQVIDSFYRLGFEVAHATKSEDALYRYGQKLSSKDHREHLTRQHSQITEMVQKIKDLERAQTKTLNKLDEEKQSLVSQIDESNKLNQELRSKLVTILFLVGLCVLSGLLFWLTRRLGIVTTQLSVEKRSTQRERELKDAAEQRLIRHERMESLGALAGGIAHDFNNLLVGVMGNAELIQTAADSESEFVQQRAKQIIDASTKAAELSQQMLSYSGKGVMARHLIDLNEMANAIVPILNHNDTESAPVRLKLFDSPVMIKCDTTQMDQVVLNLVSNAQQHSDPESEIEFTVGTEQISDHDVIGDPILFGNRNQGGDFGFLEIKDSGMGIPPSEIDNIFVPFFSNSKGGRGLGLAVVWGIVSAHKGLIRVSSNENGTAFRVLIPLAAEKPEDVSNAPHFLDNSKRLPENLERILVVDDEPGVLDYIQNVAEIAGIEFSSATNGAEALERIKQETENGTPFSAVVLDVDLPELSGEQVLQDLRRINIGIPVVMMSGKNQGRLNQYLAYDNVVGVLEKPFTGSHLLALVDHDRQTKQTLDQT